jgi:hypothetical protein
MAKEVTEYFEQCISRWLETEKQKDAAFAKKVEESGKNVEGCCNYILQQVKASKLCGYADEEVYGMARHYFDEEELKDPGSQGASRVVVSGHIDLSESEKAEAMAQAVRNYEAELKQKDLEAKKKAEESEKERKAKLREQKVKETAVQGDLFGF